MLSKKFNRRDLLRLSVLIVVVAALVGCTTPTPEVIVQTQVVKETEQVEVPVEQTLVVEPTPEPLPEAGPLEGEITIATIRGAMLEWMQDTAEEFMAENPNVTVNAMEAPEGGQVEAMIAAGNQPDIFVGSFGYMPAKWAAMDVLVPLEDLPGADELFASLEPNTLYKYYGHY